jgi:hypothetical protein
MIDAPRRLVPVEPVCVLRACRAQVVSECAIL